MKNINNKFLILFLLLTLSSFGVSSGNSDEDFISHSMGPEIGDETPMVQDNSGNSENDTALEPSSDTFLSSKAGKVFIGTKIIGVAGISMAVIFSRPSYEKNKTPSP